MSSMFALSQWLSCVYAFQFENHLSLDFEDLTLWLLVLHLTADVEASVLHVLRIVMPRPHTAWDTLGILMCRKFWKLPVVSDALILLLENFSTLIFQRVFDTVLFPRAIFCRIPHFYSSHTSIFSSLKLLPFFPSYFVCFVI